MYFMMIAGQMLSLFFIMVIGYMMYKVRIIDDTATVRYTRLVLNVSVPAQIITSFMNSRGVVSNGEVFSAFGLAALSFVVYTASAILFTLVARVPKKERGTYFFMNLFGNVGFMGFPVITAIFGEEGMIYAVILNVVFNLLVYSVGIVLMGGDGAKQKFNPRLLLNMPFISSILSVLLFFTKLQFPAPVMTSLGYLGNLTTPVAMLILGSTIAAMPIKELFDDWRVYLFTAFRLVLTPLAVTALFRSLGLAASLAGSVMIVLAAMPVATNATMISIEYGGDVRLASRGIFFSTVLAVVSIPLIAMYCVF